MKRSSLFFFLCMVCTSPVLANDTKKNFHDEWGYSETEGPTGWDTRVWVVVPAEEVTDRLRNLMVTQEPTYPEAFAQVWCDYDMSYLARPFTYQRDDRCPINVGSPWLPWRGRQWHVKYKERLDTTFLTFSTEYVDRPLFEPTQGWIDLNPDFRVRLDHWILSVGYDVERPRFRVHLTPQGAEWFVGRGREGNFRLDPLPWLRDGMMEVSQEAEKGVDGALHARE